MNKTEVNLSVAETANTLISMLREKGFTIFCDIDHQANASSVDLEMPASRSIIFGNPLAGTKLMLKDIAISFDLPLRIAVVDDNGQTIVIHQTSEDYCSNYQVEGHPILEKIDSLFSNLVSAL